MISECPLNELCAEVIASIISGVTEETYLSVETKWSKGDVLRSVS
jgi:hypothetical protein